MTNQTPENVIAEVIEYHADTIGSHYDGCYKHHAVCLAVKLRNMLREPGVPDAATAALERVRAVVKSIRFLAALPPFDEGNTVMNAAADDIVAALDGTSESEVQPSSTVDEAALIREAKAEAWDEGYWQGINGHTGPGNPYRDCGAAEYREGIET